MVSVIISLALNPSPCLPLQALAALGAWCCVQP